MTMTLDEAIERFTNNAEYERTHENLQGCLDFRQLAEWLKDYKRLKEQEPKTGQWIEERNDYGKIMCWHCSNCYDDSGFITTCKWDYCPNCGAKMESEEV